MFIEPVDALRQLTGPPCALFRVRVVQRGFLGDSQSQLTQEVNGKSLKMCCVNLKKTR